MAAALSSHATSPVKSAITVSGTTDPSKLEPIEQAKRLAAFAAVDRHVKPEHKVIGIGSGSTVPYVVDRLIEQGPEINAERVFLPTGYQSRELIIQAGFKLGEVDLHEKVDVTIDGADEVDKDLNAIKGGGACQLREKVLAEAADTWVMVADYRKNGTVLGENWKQGIPIEVAPFAYATVLRRLAEMGSPTKSDPNVAYGKVLTLRMGKAKAGPVVSDNANFIIDAPFPREMMEKPTELLTKIKLLTGVVEVGLFCNMAKAAYFGNADGSVTIKWADGREENVEERKVDDAEAAPKVAKEVVN